MIRYCANGKREGFGGYFDLKIYFKGFLKLNIFPCLFLYKSS